MHRLVRLLAITAALLPAGALATGSSAATPPHFQATFVDIYSQCPINPPTLVFCGDGNIAGIGKASSTAHLTAPPAPIPGTDCLTINAVRTITLADGSGSLNLTEEGTKCPPSEAAGNNAAGSPYTVAKAYVITGGTGVFAGASGSGTDINRSAGNSQVSDLSGSITLA
jgi:hypothetical protein